MYLKIENLGVTDPDAFTLLGASTKRGDNTKIGQFGSGTKFGAAVLMRHGIYPIIYTDKLRIVYGLRDKGFADTRRVFVTIGNIEENLGFCAEYGEIDWNDVSMALREYVSNALDEVNPVIEIVDDSQVRAKAGHTRVFIPLGGAGGASGTNEVLKFYKNLAKWFLHLANKADLSASVLPKADRNFEEQQTAVIYRRGVRVREVGAGGPSLFDYNLDMPIDEARKMGDYSVAIHAATALAKAPPEIIASFLMSFGSDKAYWEHTFSSHYLIMGPYVRWHEAAVKYMSHAVFAKKDSLLSEIVKKRGYSVVDVPANIYEVLVTIGLRNANTILTEDEQKGRIITEPHSDMVRVVGNIFDRLRYTNHYKPKVMGFDENMKAEGLTKGFYRENVVYLNNSMVPGDSLELWQTAVEEIAHHVTGATDMSRDLQDYTFKELAAFLRKA